MILCFELSMPNRGSWNNKWSGDDCGHYLFRTSNAAETKKIFQALDGKQWWYSWPDGWSACIEAYIVTAKEKRRLQKKNGGFCSYNWMVDSIIKHGEIRKSG